MSICTKSESEIIKRADRIRTRANVLLSGIEECKGRRQRMELPLPGNVMAGRYEIVSAINRGGMGLLYKAMDISDSRKVVALKMANESEQKWGDNVVGFFAQESVLANELEHPQLIKGYMEALVSEGMMFFPLEFVDAPIVFHAVNGIPMPWKIARQIIMQICDVLEYLHNEGIVHRDIKPSNIFMEECEGGFFARLFDLGLAKVEGISFDREYVSVGTEGYKSPEQKRYGDIDYRSDIFSLGITIYKMLMGEVVDESHNAELGRLAQISGIPASAAEIIRVAIDNNPDSRFQSAKQMKEAIESCQSQ